jgi:hypothetical protein
MKTIVSYCLGILLSVLSVSQGQDSTRGISNKTDEAKEEKIANAISAAPASITDSATVMDWPAGEEGRLITLRKGSNAFTCIPDRPDTPENDPMCLDKQWMQWLDAWINDEMFNADQIGFGYMLQGGLMGDSTDYNSHGGYEKKESMKSRDGDNERHERKESHVMILVPDTTLLKKLPKTPESGGPWVVFHGTPFAYISVPVGMNRNIEHENGSKAETESN